MRQIKINSTTGAEIITRSEAKNFCRIDTNADDTLVDAIIVAARIAAENYLSRDIVAKNRTYYVDFSTDGIIDIPFGPVASIVSVIVNGTTLQASDYDTRGLGDLILEIDPDQVDIKITYTTSGMSDNALKQSLLLMVSTMYDNRTDSVVGSSVNELPFTSKTILDGYKNPFI